MARPKYRSLRRPKTTQERRLFSQLSDWEEEYGTVYTRPNRNARRLPNAWDDIPIRANDKSWKAKRKTQQHENKRHQFEFYIDGVYNGRDYERFFIEQSISCSVEPVVKSKIVFSTYRNEYVTRFETIGYHIVWWHDKDVGINFFRPNISRHWF